MRLPAYCQVAVQLTIQLMLLIRLRQHANLKGAGSQCTLQAPAMLYIWTICGRGYCAATGNVYCTHALSPSDTHFALPRCSPCSPRCTPCSPRCLPCSPDAHPVPLVCVLSSPQAFSNWQRQLYVCTVSILQMPTLFISGVFSAPLLTFSN